MTWTELSRTKQDEIILRSQKEDVFALAKEFGIDEGRMETDGKGESEPIDKNDNPAGKANNRRVEFIKF